jgi:hypothetical protein
MLEFAGRFLCFDRQQDELPGTLVEALVMGSQILEPAEVLTVGRSAANRGTHD